MENEENKGCGCLLSIAKGIWIMFWAVFAYGVAFILEIILFIPLVIIHIISPDGDLAVGCLIKGAGKFFEEVLKENK